MKALTLALFLAAAAGAAHAADAPPAGGLDTRLPRPEARPAQNAQLFDLLREIEQLRAELARLRGDIELQGHQVETLAKRQTDLYTDLDQRLGELQKKAVAPAAEPAPAAAPPVPDAAVEARVYEDALTQFRGNNYAAAIAAFREFLRQFPQSALAPNAQYWIGYSYYAMKDYKSALAQQQKFLLQYPASPKAPDAMLNLATNQILLNDLAAGRKTLETLVADYPSANAATLARRRLDALK